MLKERDLEKKVVRTGLRIGAALLAVQMSLGMDRVAHADINEPVRYQQADGRLLADAPLRTAGRAVDFTGPQGLEFCGTSTTEPTILTVVANEDLMNIKVVGNPDTFVDPIEVGGSDYSSRAAAAVEALQSKATELINGTNRLWRRVGIILTRDAVNQDVCDLITDSGPFAQPAKEVPAPQPAVPALPELVPAASPVAPAVVTAPSRPIAVAGALWCPPDVVVGRSLSSEIRGANGAVIGRIYGGQSRVGPGGLDLADHDPFVNTLTAIRNVAGDPGAIMADIDRSPGENFFNLDNLTAPGLSRNAAGQVEWSRTIGRHRILRTDAEDLCLSLKSRERDLLIDLGQYAPGPGGQAHHTLFVRLPYFDESVVRLFNPTIPGTQVQVVGPEGSAFASERAFRDGVPGRQSRPNYPNYLVWGVNANDLSVGAAQSTGPGQPFVTLGTNY